VALASRRLPSLSDNRRGRLLVAGFVVGVAGLIFAGFDENPGHSTRSLVVRVVFGLVLLAEGLVLTMRRFRGSARQLVVQRLLALLGRGSFWRFVFDPLVWLAGFGFIVVGALELARAVQSAF
jgi:hypothetical protein